MRAAILLAAGSSRRFGRGNKLLAMLHGRPVLGHAVRRARRSGAVRIVVIVPSLGGRIGRMVAREGKVMRVAARRHRDGLAASLAAGLAALRPVEREVLIFLGDMPLAAAPSGMRLRPGLDAVRPVFRGRPGHPMLVRATAAHAAMVRGDQGLAARLSCVGRVRSKAGNLIDIDTRAVLRAENSLSRAALYRRN